MGREERGERRDSKDAEEERRGEGRKGGKEKVKYVETNRWRREKDRRTR